MKTPVIFPSPGSMLGTVFNNEASIFFATNPPITTNMVATEVTEPTVIVEQREIVETEDHGRIVTKVIKS